MDDKLMQASHSPCRASRITFAFLYTFLIPSFLLIMLHSRRFSIFITGEPPLDARFIEMI